MHFIDLEAGNFMSIREVSLQLQRQGLVILTGSNLDDPSAESNGSGKSALIESIYWCLYGKVLRRARYVDDVVNRRAKRNCYVRMTVQVQEGTLKIERYRKHKEHKNNIYVHLNDQPKHATDPRVTQRVLDKLLGMDAEMFARLVLIGQGFTKRFTDMTDRELKEFIEGMTGSLLYAKAHSAASAKLTEAEKNQETATRTLQYLDEQISGLQANVTEEAAKVQQLEQQRTQSLEAHTQTLQQNQAEIDQLAAAISRTQAERDSNVAQYDKQIQDWDNHIASLQASLDNVDAVRKQWRDAQAQKENAENLEVDAQLDTLKLRHSSEIGEAQQAVDAATKARDDAIRGASARRAEIAQTQETSRSELEQEVAALNQEVSGYRFVAVDQSFHDNLASAEARLKALDDMLEDLQEEIGTKCPQCGQEITQESLRRRVLERYNPDEERSKIVHGPDGIEACKKALQEAQDAADAERSRIEGRQELLRQKSAELQALRDAHSRELSEHDAQAATIPSQHVEPIQQASTQVAELRGRHGAEISAIEDQRRAIRQRYVDLEAEYDTQVETTRQEWRNKITEATQQRQAVIDVRDGYNRDVQTTIATQQGSQATYERSNADIREEIAKLEAQNYRAALDALSGRLQGLQKQAATEGKTLQEAEENVATYGYLATAFGLGGIRSYMIDSILSYLNERLSVYCAYLFDRRVQISLSPVREQKNKAVVDKVTMEVTTDGGSYDMSSGGERRKVDVAIFLAFRDLNRMINPVKVNLESYDEILSFLDGEAASRVIQLLVADQSVETKILITHRTDVPIVGAHKTLKAVKQSGFTSYVAA